LGKTLISYSGGADSCWVAYNTLKTTDDEVWLAWFDQSFVSKFQPGMANTPYLGVYQRKNVNKTASYLRKNIRNFHVLKLSYPSVDKDDNTLHEILRIRKYSEIIKELQIDNYYDGHGVSRMDMPRDNIDWSFILGDDPQSKKIAESGGIMSGSSQGDKEIEILSNVNHQKPAKKSGKNIAIRYSEMGKELYDLTGSCVRPEIIDGTIQSCEKCTKCMWSSLIKDFVENKNIEPEKFVEWFWGNPNEDYTFFWKTENFTIRKAYIPFVINSLANSQSGIPNDVLAGITNQTAINFRNNWPYVR